VDCVSHTWRELLSPNISGRIQPWSEIDGAGRNALATKRRPSKSSNPKTTEVHSEIAANLAPKPRFSPISPRDQVVRLDRGIIVVRPSLVSLQTCGSAASKVTAGNGPSDTRRKIPRPSSKTPRPRFSGHLAQPGSPALGIANPQCGRRCRRVVGPPGHGA
jgi:hypothetical protein